jgi:UDP-sugar pyrophosphorylase
VPCLSDSDASLALDPSDPCALLTKPHGHGDVHALLHASGEPEHFGPARPAHGACCQRCDAALLTPWGALRTAAGLANKFHASGVTHLIFLQDTNALVFGGVPAALGLSSTHQFAMNTISVARKAGDASGALMRLTADSGNGTSLTVNVEYNRKAAPTVAAAHTCRAHRPRALGAWRR